jgi:hypothetical protein
VQQGTDPRHWIMTMGGDFRKPFYYQTYIADKIKTSKNHCGMELFINRLDYGNITRHHLNTE